MSQQLAKIDDPERHKAELYKSINEWPEGSKYSLEQKLAVLTEYWITGSLRAVERNLGVPMSTLVYWKKNSPWWDEQITQLSTENTARFSAKQRKIIDKASDVVMDRLENGDFQVMRDGNTVRKPVSCRDASIVMAVAFDKDRIAQALPTNYNSSSVDAFTQVLGKLAEVGQTMQQNTQKPAIDVERVDSEDPKDK